MNGQEERRANDLSSLLDPRLLDPTEELVTRSHLSDDDVAQTVAVLEAMSAWRGVERAMGERLGDTDMRALRYLIAAQRQGVVATPGSIAAHLAISPAATTKLMDRLESGGHIRRRAHPDDRRSTAIDVTPETLTSARATVGRSHARRFDAVSQLSPADRAAVLRFFDALVSASDE